MQIVDAQIHVWGEGLPTNKSHWQVTSFTTEEAVSLMDEAGVDAAIIHPPSWDPNADAMAEKAVADYPGRFAIMGALPLDQATSEAAISTWREQPGMLGLRYLFRDETVNETLRHGGYDWLWAAAAAAGVPVAVLADGSLADFAEIAARFPDLRLTIDHLGGRGGFETRRDHAAMSHIPTLLELAKYPNIAVKVTGAPGYSGENYPYPIIQFYLKQIYDAFGADRMFWGTDISKMPCNWRDCITMFTEAADWLPPSDREKVMGASICNWWGWDR